MRTTAAWPATSDVGPALGRGLTGRDSALPGRGEAAWQVKREDDVGSRFELARAASLPGSTRRIGGCCEDNSRVTQIGGGRNENEDQNHRFNTPCGSKYLHNFEVEVRISYSMRPDATRKHDSARNDLVKCDLPCCHWLAAPLRGCKFRPACDSADERHRQPVFWVGISPKDSGQRRSVPRLLAEGSAPAYHRSGVLEAWSEWPPGLRSEGSSAAASGATVRESRVRFRRPRAGLRGSRGRAGSRRWRREGTTRRLRSGPGGGRSAPSCQANNNNNYTYG